MPVPPATGGFKFVTDPGNFIRPHLKIKNERGVCGSVVECVPSKCEALDSIPSVRERERERGE